MERKFGRLTEWALEVRKNSMKLGCYRGIAGMAMMEKNHTMMSVSLGSHMVRLVLCCMDSLKTSAFRQ